MDLWQHAVISAAGSAGFYLAGDLPAALAFSATGILVDLDHLPDYWRETGLNLDLPRFFSHFQENRPRSLWLVLHAWEWAAVGTLAAFVLHAPLWGWAALAGFVVHLILDQAFNRLHPLAYWFLYRAKVGFRGADILGPARGA